MTMDYRYGEEQLLELSNEHLLSEYAKVVQALETTRSYEKIDMLITYRVDLERIILKKMQ